MGLFGDYGVKPEDIKDNNFDIDDGTYRFEISEAEQQDGTTNNPDNTVVYIEYQLEDEDGDAVGTTRSYYTLAEGGDSETKRAQQSWGYFKGDLKKLGVMDLDTFELDDLLGIKGVLQLKSSPGKGANKDTMYQNVRNIRVDEEEEEAPAPKKAPAKKPAAKAEAPKAEADAAAKARVKEKQAARAAEPSDEGDDEDNPFG